MILRATIYMESGTPFEEDYRCTRQVMQRVIQDPYLPAETQFTKQLVKEIMDAAQVSCRITWGPIGIPWSHIPRRKEAA